MQSAIKDNLVRIPVRIDMLDGSRLDLSLISPRALLKMHELINREEPFIDVESHDGERFVIAKTAIKSVKPRDIPVAKDLGQRIEDKNGFDPHRVLGVSKEQAPDAVHQAYLALVQQYHPDRFASIQLPKEVGEYIAAMSRRINMAYDMLSNAA
jgi:DnaJ-domain-containing protein 1